MQFNVRRIIFCNRLFLRYSRIPTLFLIFNTRKQSSSSLRRLVSIVYIHFSLIIINTNFIFFSFYYITKRNSSSCLGLHLTVSYSFNTMWGVSKFPHKCFNIFLLRKVFVVYATYLRIYVCYYFQTILIYVTNDDYILKRRSQEPAFLILVRGTLYHPSLFFKLISNYISRLRTFYSKGKEG